MSHSTKISIPTNTDVSVLTELARITFLQSHGHSSPKKDIDNYLSKHFTEDAFKQELADKQNIYRLLYCENKLVGYSKIRINNSHKDISSAAITKLERLYFLEDFIGLGLAKELLEFNIEIARNNKQAGVWLFVWTENKRAIHFYTKHGFKIVGSHDFFVSPTYSNPNHVMFLELD